MSSTFIETAPLQWWYSVGLFNVLACKASSVEVAFSIMGASPYAAPTGQMQDKEGKPSFMPQLAPPELAEWLDTPQNEWIRRDPQSESGYTAFWRVPGGYVTNNRTSFVPVWGASGIRVVEKTHIVAARHG